MGDTLVEGSINHNTAVVLALAVTIEASEGAPEEHARETVLDRYDWAREQVFNRL